MDLSIIVPLFIVVIFIVVVVGLLVAIFKAIAQWRHNNLQPISSERAQVVAKRTRVSGHNSSHYNSRTTTFYYCTFEDERGTRHEFQVSGPEYGLLVEGDLGRLSYQGTRYKGFQRQ
ncbi:DUF2500 domain-containing protein [Pseudanabaena sp. FACHB-2040]|uniref:DUF2500 domain-containing protein n=1 Tax=Pseudanabaena sp. FACHB-2040 TaxID=2692859 RepID=UPI001688C149|nr:DUF2500 domain-containing protein [Pseudanabaena sp. FACHB-2040]MBD2260519.1 DUF2500 domain-containing protein [Pseudanabaena sp. FACHB-2040]